MYDAGIPIPLYQYNNRPRVSTAGITAASLALAQSLGDKTVDVYSVFGSRAGSLGWATPGLTDIIGTPGVSANGAIRYPELNGTEVLEIVSTSLADAPAGIGARSVHIYTLTPDRFRQPVEVALNGTTPVELTGIKIGACNFMEVLTSGVAETAQGTIDLRIKSGGVYAPGTVVERIGPNQNRSRSCRHTLPMDRSGVIFQWGVGQDSNGSPQALFFIRMSALTYDKRRTPGIYHFMGEARITPGEDRHYPLGLYVPPGTTAKISVDATALTAGSVVQSEFLIAEIEV